MPRSYRTLVLLAGLLGAAMASGAAQQATSFEVGFLGAVNPFQTSAELVQLGLRVATVEPNEVGVDFSLATLPVLDVQGLLIVGSDLDVSWIIPLGNDAHIAPRAGVSGAFAAAVGEGGGAGAAFGYNFGVGVLQRSGPATAVRFDYTYRRLAVDHESLPLSSFTVGFVWIH